MDIFENIPSMDSKLSYIVTKKFIHFQINVIELSLDKYSSSLRRGKKDFINFTE